MGAIAEARANPLALLISVGARVEPPTGAKNDQEAQIKNELRRKQRNITVFLSKTLDIEPKAKPSSDAAPSKGGKKKNAYEVAKDTKIHPVGGEREIRVQRATRQAKSARKLFRANKSTIDSELKKKTLSISKA